MKEMVTIIPSGACPVCGHNQFVVSEHQVTEYLTNRDGEIIDVNEASYDAVGMCCNCKSIFEMQPTREGFIPLTKLRKILFEYTPHAPQYEVFQDLDNPMEVDE